MFQINSANKTLVIVAAVLLVSLWLGWLSPVRDFIVWASKPVAIPTHKAAVGLTRSISGIFSIKDLQRENSQLKERVVLLESENTSLRNSVSVQEELTKALNLKSRTGFDLTAARIVSSDPSSLNQVLLIDRGANAGLVDGQAVVDSAGAYIGRVTKVLNNTSEVTLVSDTTSRIPVKIVESDARGVLVGEHALSAALTEVPQGQNIPTNGRIVTAGFTPGIPEGLLIGYADSLRSEGGDLFQEANVRPAADLRQLNVIFVIVGIK